VVQALIVVIQYRHTFDPCVGITRLKTNSVTCEYLLPKRKATADTYRAQLVISPIAAIGLAVVLGPVPPCRPKPDAMLSDS